MKTKFLLLFSACILHPLPTLNAQVHSTSKLPNVVLIFADDLGYGELGSYGQQKIKTPHLDQLAKEGLQLQQFYTGTPVCAPSRANLMTGLHAGHAQIRGNHGLNPYQENGSEPGSFPLKAGTFTLANLFKNKGYATAAIGKWGLGNYDNEGDPLKLGFDYFYGYYDQRHAHNYFPTHLWENGQVDSLANLPIDVHPKKGKKLAYSAYIGKEYAIDKMMEKATGFIEKYKNQPFFLYLPITLPHGVLQKPSHGIEDYKEAFQEKPNHSNEITPYPKSTYAAMISYLDEQVGLIQELLKKNHLSENTIIIFTSDNGPAAGADIKFFQSTAGLRGAKQDVYEGGIRVPFLIKWPGVIAAGQQSSVPAISYDLLASFAEILQSEVQHTDGRSLVDIFKGKNVVLNREFLYWEYPAKSGQLAIRIGDFKGVKTQLNKNPKTDWQLYNLADDPEEKNDISAKHPQLLKQMDAIFAKEHTEAQLPEWNLFSVPLN